MHQLCQKIIEEEKGKGHTALAQQLENILKQPRSKTLQPVVFARREKELGQLPTSRRYNDPLVSTILHDALRHHMVLDAKIEAKFHRIEEEYIARERLALYGLVWPAWVRQDIGGGKIGLEYGLASHQSPIRCHDILVLWRISGQLTAYF